MLICCGLYDLLRGILLLLPDLMLEEVMDKLIQPEALIVLVNHSSPLIQQGVMKVNVLSSLKKKNTQRGFFCAVLTLVCSHPVRKVFN